MGFRWPWQREREREPESPPAAAPVVAREPWDGSYWFARAGGWDDVGPIATPQQDEVEGPPVVGRRGLHACARLLDALEYARSGALCFVRLSGDVVTQGSQRAATERVIQRMVDAEEAIRAVAAKELSSLLGEPLGEAAAHTASAESRRTEALALDKRARDVAWQLERGKGERATLEGEKRGLEQRIVEARFEALLHEAAACIPARGLEPRVFEHLREAYAEHGEERAAAMEARLEKKLRASVEELPELAPAAQAVPEPTPRVVRPVEDSWLSDDGPFRVSVALTSPLAAQAALPPRQSWVPRGPGKDDEPPELLTPLLGRPDLEKLVQHLHELGEVDGVVATGLLDPEGGLRDRPTLSHLPLVAVTGKPHAFLAPATLPPFMPVVVVSAYGRVRTTRGLAGYELDVHVWHQATQATEHTRAEWTVQDLRMNAPVPAAKWLLAGEPSVLRVGWLEPDLAVVHASGVWELVRERLDGVVEAVFVHGSTNLRACQMTRDGRTFDPDPGEIGKVRSALRRHGWYRNTYHPCVDEEAVPPDTPSVQARCQWCDAAFDVCPKEPLYQVGCGECGQDALRWLRSGGVPEHTDRVLARVQCNNCKASFISCIEHEHVVCLQCTRLVGYTIR